MIRVYYKIIKGTAPFVESELLTPSEYKGYLAKTTRRPKYEIVCADTKKCYWFFGARFVEKNDEIPVQKYLDELRAHHIELTVAAGARLWHNFLSDTYTDNISQWVRGYGHLNVLVGPVKK